MNDLVHHPNHYQRCGVECFEINQWMNFMLGNVVKYVFRAGLKDSMPEALQKAHANAVRWCQRTSMDPSCEAFVRCDPTDLDVATESALALANCTTGRERVFWESIASIADSSTNEWPYVIHDNVASLMVEQGMNHKDCPLFEEAPNEA